MSDTAKKKEEAHFQPGEVAEMNTLNCMECDSEIGYFPLNVKYKGDPLPVYCYVCAVALNKEH